MLTLENGIEYCEEEFSSEETAQTQKKKTLGCKQHIVFPNLLEDYKF